MSEQVEIERDPKRWFGGSARVMFVHAHPDDETITTGGTLAGLAQAGLEPLLVTLTRGERGEVVPGPLTALAEMHGLAFVRQNELRTALGMLGAAQPPERGPSPEEAAVGPSAEVLQGWRGVRHAFLGVPPARAEGLDAVIYEDSGMAWGEDGRATAAPEASPDALTSVPAAEPLYDLLAAAYLSSASAIVSYGGGGGYGHPDHVLAHRLSRAVARALEIPFWEIVPDPSLGFVEVEDLPASTGEVLEFEEHDVTPWMERKLAALRAYATQLTVQEKGTGHEIVHVGNQRERVAFREAFRQVVA